MGLLRRPGSLRLSQLLMVALSRVIFALGGCTTVAGLCVGKILLCPLAPSSGGLLRSMTLRWRRGWRECGFAVLLQLPQPAVLRVPHVLLAACYHLVHRLWLLRIPAFVLVCFDRVASLPEC